MEAQNCLGIYFGKTKATVVCLGGRAKDGHVQGCFTVAAPADNGPSLQALSDLITHGCSQRGLKFSDVAVALDSDMFMQHSVHSDFKDAKKIAATVKFDAEEALATDIAEAAVAFRIDPGSGSEQGSELTVFTARRDVLSEALLALQSNELDPYVIEPDVVSLARYISRDPGSPAQQGGTLLGVLSPDRGYLLSLPEPGQIAAMRTFLVPDKQDRSELLAREAMVSVALAGSSGAVERVGVFDTADQVDRHLLAQKVGTEVVDYNLVAPQTLDDQTLAHCDDQVGYAIACGVAMAQSDRVESVNFRDDFMPYQGKKRRLQGAVKVLGVSASILLLAVGAYLHMQLLKTKGYRAELRRKFEPAYLAVLPGESKVPPYREAARKLGSSLRAIENNRKGVVTDREAIPARLTLLLEAFNSCARQANLNIQSITISAANTTVVGDTSSRTNTLKLFDAIGDVGFDPGQPRLYEKDQRDHFSISVVPAGG